MPEHLLTYGSLCSGVHAGGLDLAVEEVFGARQVWHAETDKDAARVMARHWGTPNLGDITAAAWEHVEPVDLICAGYPCQPFSVAGKRKGSDDHRHLWPHVARAIGALGPRIVVLENVAGHLRLGFDAVLSDLADLGFDAEWTTLRASDVGACHRRERLFVVAPHANILASHVDEGGSTENERVHGARLDRDGRGPAAHPSGEPGRLQPVGLAGSSGAAAVADVGAGSPADAESLRRQGHERPAWDRGHGPVDGRVFPWGRYAPAIERWERIFGPAPWPVVEGTRSLSGDFTAWMMGMEPGWMDGLSNTAKKRCAGNAVMTAQAVAAIKELVSDE